MKKTNLFKRAIAVFISVLMVISSLPFTAITASAAEIKHDGNEVFGFVTIDPVLYIHGSYTTAMNDVADLKQFDYMMYGDIVADGSYDGECKTAVSSSKTITSVDVIDTDAKLTVSDGLLHGSLGGGYGGSESAAGTGTTGTSTVTLRFNFSDGKYEYHKLPVKTNPVAQHAIGWAQRYTTGGTWKRGVAFEVLAIGSYGQTNEGSYTRVSMSGNVANNAHRNFISMYRPYSTVFDAYDPAKIDGMTVDHLLNTNKEAGYGVAVNGRNDNQHLQITSKSATYYLDLSSDKNYGVTKQNDSYYIKMLVGNLYHNFTSENINKSSRTMTGGTEGTITNFTSRNIDTNGAFSGGSSHESLAHIEYKVDDPVAGSTKNMNFSTSYRNSDSTYSQLTINMPINIVVSDKTTLRSKYNKYINDLKNGVVNCGCFSEETWNAFESKLLEVEEYLNDNTDTSSSDALLSALNSAYNALSHTRSLSTRNANFVNVDSKTLLATTCDTTKECKYDVQTYCTVCDKTISSRTVNVDRLQHSYTGESVYTPVDGDNNGYTQKYCVNGCNELGGIVYDTQDWAAYDAQVAVANDNANNAAKYTAESRAAYQSAVDAITSTVDKTDVTKSRAYIDNLVTAIDACKEKLVLMQYQIEFSYEIDGTSKVVKSDSYDYGSEIEMTVPSDVDGTVYKWTKTIGGKDSTMSTVSRTITYYVGGSNASVIAYLVKVEKETTADNHIVKMYSFNNRVIDSKVVNNNGTIDITKMNQNEVVFYDITGYTVNGVNIDLDDASSYTVTGDLEIKPIYTPKNDDRVFITLDGDATIGKQTGGVYTAAWDVKLTVKGTNTTESTVWKVDGKVVGYGATYTFRATRTCTITYENDATVDGVSSLNYLDYGKYLDHAITVVGSYDVPQGATNVRAGVFLKTVKNPADTSKQLTFEEITTGNTTGKKYAEVFTDTNQYKIVITRTANTPILIGAVAFVEYELDGNPVVKYSAPQTIFGEN